MDSSPTTSKTNFYDEKVLTTLRLFRLLSLLLTSVFYILHSPAWTTENSLILFSLILFSLIIIFVYNRLWANAKIVTTLVLGEMLGIAVLVYHTGMWQSPFIWYVLNVIIIASIFLHYMVTWILIGGYLAAIISWDFFISGTFRPAMAYFIQHSDIVLILVLMTLAVQIFARLYFTLVEQSQVLKQQQDELFTTYKTLADNHRMIQVLSDFQRDAISSKNELEVYRKLIKVTDSFFPLQKTAVLLFDKPLPPYSLTPHHPCKVIANLPNGNLLYNNDLLELKDSWQDFATKQMITGSKKEWIALPIRGKRGTVMAVFTGWLIEGTHLHDFPGHLPLFIYFTEQLVQSLSNLRQTEHLLQHLSSLYEAVETITSRDNLQEIIDIFAAYAKTLTGCTKVILWVEKTNSQGAMQNPLYSVRGQRNVLPEELWYADLISAWAEIQNNPEPVWQNIRDTEGEEVGQLVCVPVQSGSRCFGILAAVQNGKMYNADEQLNTLSFIAKLSSVAIERNIAELFEDRLLLIEEQNRIANEIHDGVSQNLFSIVYGVDALVKQTTDILDTQMQEQLFAIRDVAAKTAKELRLLIYRLSPRHREDETFAAELRTYFKDFEALNNVQVTFNLSGKEEYLNPSISGAFYRIIKEAMGNAVRHGKCTKITVDLEMTPFGSSLKITDNGMGFNVKPYYEADRKNLGLVNMRELARSLKGSLNIDSAAGKPTTISCYVPTSPVSSGRAYPY